MLTNRWLISLSIVGCRCAAVRIMYGCVRSPTTKSIGSTTKQNPSPVCNVMSNACTLRENNSEHVRTRPGRKTFVGPAGALVHRATEIKRRSSMVRHVRTTTVSCCWDPVTKKRSTKVPRTNKIRDHFALYTTIIQQCNNTTMCSWWLFRFPERSVKTYFCLTPPTMVHHENHQRWRQTIIEYQGIMLEQLPLLAVPAAAVTAVRQHRINPWYVNTIYKVWLKGPAVATVEVVVAVAVAILTSCTRTNCGGGGGAICIFLSNIDIIYFLYITFNNCIVS